jgi:hypothetical protein
MSWFSFSRKGLSDDLLRTALFDSVASGDTRNVETLVSRHRERVAALFPSWTTVPAEVRPDALRTKWWAEGALGVAKAAAQFGDSSMMARLLGPPGDNILIEWQDALRSALTDSTGGHYMSSIRILEGMIERTSGLKGSGVDGLLPKTYGLLGTVYYLAGHRDTGRTYTEKAKEYCERIGDVEGVEVYATHLRNINSGIDLAEARGIALLNANEDYAGFYELIWEFNTRYPTASEAEKLEAARTTLACLLEDGLVALYAARWSPPMFTSIKPVDGAAIIADPQSWQPPCETSEGTYFAFGATQRGKLAYKSP